MGSGVNAMLMMNVWGLDCGREQSRQMREKIRGMFNPWQDQNAQDNVVFSMWTTFLTRVRVNHARRQPARQEKSWFGALLRDTSTLSKEEPGIELSSFRLRANPLYLLSHIPSLF